MMKYFNKKTILGVIAASMMTMSGCNSWLDVQPIDSMTEEQLYSSESGIQRALNGLYLNMTSSTLYTEQLGGGILDVMGQYYKIGSEHRYYHYSTYSYSEKDEKNTWAGIWDAAYTLIANCNEFLAQVDQHPDLMSDNEYNMMKGEALAIRTMLHFDMFRLFGPVYNEENASVTAVPYYDHVTDVAQPLLSGADMMEHLLADIDEAIELLSHDVILTEGLGDEDDDFWAYRNLRMNYYAGLALKARICWYINDTEHNTEAYTIASSLLAGENPVTGGTCNFKELFTPVSSLNAANQDPTFYSESIFAMHNINRIDVHKDLFSTDLDDNNILLSTQTYINNLFENATTDYRYGIWEAVTGRNETGLVACTKFASQNSSSSSRKNYAYESQPLFTLGELYLIAAATAPDEATQSFYVEQLRVNRGYQNNNMQGRDVATTLQSEWKKEVFGEGQFYFYLKRNNLNSTTGVNGNTSVNFTIPLPETETDNRRD